MKWIVFIIVVVVIVSFIELSSWPIWFVPIIVSPSFIVISESPIVVVSFILIVELLFWVPLELLFLFLNFLGLGRVFFLFGFTISS